jgi:hypothetical protein
MAYSHQDFLKLEKKIPYFERPILYYQIATDIEKGLLMSEISDIFADIFSIDIDQEAREARKKKHEEMQKTLDYIRERQKTQINIFEMDC